ncbi:YejL family protein [Zobellella denitrificans]
MPVLSKYDKQYDQLLSELEAVMDKHQAPADLRLMVLGNLVTHVLNHQVAPGQRKAIADKFAKVLTASVDKQKGAH